MEFSVDQLYHMIASYLWAFVRIGSMFTSMIVLSAQFVTLKVRLLLALALTVLVVPMIPAIPLEYTQNPLSLQGMLIIGQQVLIGVSIGFISQMVLQAFVLAAQVLAMQAGLGFASMMDPANGMNVPLLSQFLLMMTTLLFLSLDGHLLMFQMIASSFETLPIGPQGLSLENIEALINWGRMIFVIAIMVGLSAIISLLLVNISFGIMTKVAPQLNIFAVGFPITLQAALLLFWFVIAEVVGHFNALWDNAFQLMCQMVNMECL